MHFGSDPLRGSQPGGFQATPFRLAFDGTYHRFVYARSALGFESEFVEEDRIKVRPYFIGCPAAESNHFRTRGAFIRGVI